MINVEIINFQNIEHLKLDISGFCVLVGESNIGKSSVCRALRCVAENTPASSFIRKGKNETKVRVTLPALRKQIEWIRSSSSPIYKLHELDDQGHIVKTQTFEKFGHDFPEPIKNLKFLRMMTPEIASLIGFSAQHRYFFLLEDSGNLVKLAGELRSIANLNKSLTQARANRKKANDEYKFHDRRLLELRPQREKLKGSESLVSDVTVIESKLQVLHSSQNRSQQLIGIRTSSNNLQKSINDNLMLLDRLKTVSDLNPLFDEVLTKQGKLQNTKSKLLQLKQLKTKLDSLNQRLGNIRPIIESLQILQNIDLGGLQEALQKIKPLRPILQQLTLIRDRYRKIQASMIENVPDVSKINNLEFTVLKRSKILTISKQSNDLLSRKLDIETNIRNNDLELESNLKEIQDFILAHPQCDVCGSKIDIKKVISV